MLQPYIAEKERKIFHDQVEWFIRQYAPVEEPHRTEFICDFITVVRDLGMQRARAFHEVASEAFRRSTELVDLMPQPPKAEQDS